MAQFSKDAVSDQWKIYYGDRNTNDASGRILRESR
ncbi:hypothetical protein KGM_205615 [Danaus plexippus plexippus]|uniref:Uncharacterized protein n=1 Tax=Danaus plexippus plexippus TaxID=278856 RepID=A0A212FN66_DANPL|nr:hypothetical protein KGM_205615 [Danaus plexippus plexippus]